MRINTFGLWVVLAVSITAAGATITCEGILGNSGEQGKTLVRFSDRKCPGLGVVQDRFGSLWDRAGAGTLNRYSADGRLLGQYKIPAGVANSDQLTLVNDTLVLLIQGRIHTLPIIATPGSSVEPTPIEAQLISFGSFQNQIAIHANGSIALADPKTGASKPIVALKNVSQLELAANGTVYAAVENKVHTFLDGKEISPPRGVPGERMQLVADAFFGHAWHGTIRRFTTDLQPDPGVVLGGSSGSFIGHLDQNAELSNGRGIAQLRDNLFAVSGQNGTIHLLDWSSQKRQFDIVRRIGATPFATSLALDNDGNVFWHYGQWKWSDSPDAPILQGINAPEELGQASMLENGRMIAPAWMWGKPTFCSGPLTGELRVQRIEKGCEMIHNPAASAIHKRDGKLLLMAIDGAGRGLAYNISNEGQYLSDAGAVNLSPSTPIKQYTSLAMKDARTLLAAGDGKLIEFTADGANWKESRRLDPADSNRICFSVDSTTLWITDATHHRVQVLELPNYKPLATFGTAAGDDPTSVSAPGLIAARNGRAIVHDAGNQRLIKLRLTP